MNHIFHYFKQTQDTSQSLTRLNSTSYSTLFQSRISNDINIILLQQNNSISYTIINTMLINFPLFLHISLHLYNVNNNNKKIKDTIFNHTTIRCVFLRV